MYIMRKVIQRHAQLSRTIVKGKSHPGLHVIPSRLWVCLLVCWSVSVSTDPPSLFVMQALLLLLVLQWLLILRSLAHPSSIWFLFIVAAVSPQYKEQNRALSVWLSGLLLILLHLLNFADRSLLLLGHIPPLGLLLGLLGHGRIAMVSFAVCVSMCAMGDGPDGPLVRSSAHGCDCL
uniref:Uncharacterized protein n=1 Tax=Physcomitrium patens TaxID=3218 RepID=A0A2K1JID5_PHYPA|nr:hypothetical protein PHYPA_018716 [Physcomitrium patens]